MRVIIAGTRNCANYVQLMKAIKDSEFNVTEVVSGGSRGVDRMGELYGHLNQIPVTVFKADWQFHKRAAGPIRNREMAEYADALIALWDGESKGTAGMIEEAKRKHLQIHVHRI